MLLLGVGSWLGWQGLIRCSMGGDFGLGFTLARSKKLSVVSDLCPGQPDGHSPYDIFSISLIIHLAGDFFA